jgi:hypothetical protein
MRDPFLLTLMSLAMLMGIVMALHVVGVLR